MLRLDPGCPKVAWLERERCADGTNQSLDRGVDGRGTNERERDQVVVIIQHRGPQEPLACLHVADKSVQERFPPSRSGP